MDRWSSRRLHAGSAEISSRTRKDVCRPFPHDDPSHTPQATFGCCNAIKPLT